MSPYICVSRSLGVSAWDASSEMLNSNKSASYRTNLETVRQFNLIAIMRIVQCTSK